MQIIILLIFLSFSGIHGAHQETNPIKNRLEEFSRDSDLNPQRFSVEILIKKYNNGRDLFAKYYKKQLESSASVASFSQKQSPPPPRSTSVPPILSSASRTVSKVTNIAKDAARDLYTWWYKGTEKQSTIPVISEDEEEKKEAPQDISSATVQTDYIQSAPRQSPSPSHEPIENEWTDIISKQELCDIIWFFYLYNGLFSENGIFFKEGSFIILGENIQAFFNALPGEARISSHLKGFDVQHFGLSFQKNSSTFALPAGKSALLYAFIPPIDIINKSRLFFKIENFGVTGWTEWIQHGEEYVIAQLRKHDQIRNLAGMISDDDPLFQKERVPEKILNKSISFVNKLEENQRKDIISLFKKFGISAIIPILDALASQKELQGQEAHIIKEFTGQIKTNYPDWALRTGNEVILNGETILRAPKLS